jgi:hypothetical protein
MDNLLEFDICTLSFHFQKHKADYGGGGDRLADGCAHGPEARIASRALAPF